MEPLIIESTKGTPKVKFLPNGDLSIQGLSLPEDPELFFSPLMNWVKNYKGENMNLDIRLNYMNTSSSKQLFTLLCDIKENLHIKSADVNWYYEQDDEDCLEIGQEFEAYTKLNFNFYEYAEASEN
jgi:hypothetical protein